jgi:hypothetical protein
MVAMLLSPLFQTGLSAGVILFLCHRAYVAGADDFSAPFYTFPDQEELYLQVSFHTWTGTGNRSMGLNLKP